MSSLINESNLLALLRHYIAGLGIVLVDKGLATSDQVQQGAGAIALLAAIAWSIWQKSQQKTEVQKALMTPPPVGEGQ